MTTKRYYARGNHYRSDAHHLITMIAAMGMGDALPIREPQAPTIEADLSGPFVKREGSPYGKKQRRQKRRRKQ